MMANSSDLPPYRPAPLPPDEAARLHALHEMRILDTEPEACFDRVVAMVQKAFAAPVVLISLIDEQRQWFKARAGTDLAAIDRSSAVCAHTILQPGILLVPDAIADPRFAANPFVTASRARFYAGAPLTTPGGQRLGTLCVIDFRPRHDISPEQQALLADYAALVMEQMQLRIAARTAAVEKRQREHTEIRLAASEERLQLFVEHAPAAIAMFDRQMRFLSASRRWAQDLGLEMHQFIGHSIYEIFPQQPPHWAALHRRCLQGEVLDCDGESYPRPGQPTEWLRWALHPWRETDGTVGGVIIFAEIITERKRAADALEANRTFMKAIAENVRDGIAACNAEGQVIFRNRALLEMAGMAPADATPPPDSRNGLRLLDPGTGRPLAPAEHPLQRALAGQEIDELEVLLDSRRAGPRTVIASGRQMRHGDGRRLGAVVTFHDVTEARLAERRLRDSEARYRSLYVNTPVALHSVDPEGRLLSVSNHWLSLLGYSREEVIGRRTVDFMTKDSRRLAIEAGIPEIRQSGFARNLHFQFVRKDGDLVDVLLSAFVERDAAGTILRSMVVLIDVTDRLRMEGQLLQAKKMEVVGQIAGGLAHDFNNILAVVLGNLELLHGDTGDARETRERMASAIEAVRQGRDLTARLLAFARRQPLTPSVVDVNDLLFGLQDLLRSTLGNRIGLQLDLAPGLPPICVDPGQLESALLNLALNARDAMPNGGRLTLGTAVADAADRPKLAQLDRPAAAYARITVSDTGTGIAREIRERIFEPFVSTKPPGKGSGLGLSMVYGFATQSGGRVHAESEAGRGSCINLFLPFDLSGRTIARTARPSAALPLGRGEKILVVEDSPSVREVAAAQLRTLGYQVCCAGSGQAALDILQAETDISLLFTDIMMPDGMSGPELAAMARQARGSLRVLFTSGQADRGLLQAAGIPPDCPVLAKPYDRDALAARIRAALDGYQS